MNENSICQAAENYINGNYSEVRKFLVGGTYEAGDRITRAFRVFEYLRGESRTNHEEAENFLNWVINSL